MLDNRQKLCDVRASFKEAFDNQKSRVLVCGGTGCLGSGAAKIYDRLKELLAENNIEYSVELVEETTASSVAIKKSGCQLFCEIGPIVRIEPEGYVYKKVKLSDCEEIVEKTVKNGEFIERLGYELNGELHKTYNEIPFYAKQKQVVLDNCGKIDPTSLNEYLATGGYKALEKALFDMTGDEIIDEVIKSNLRGRGGGGFPTGRKWSQVKRQKNPTHYVVCNGDEGDPGAFMDCSIMEHDPHKLIEGMIIAGIATDSEVGYIYVRAEYPTAVARLKQATKLATEAGLLGNNILGSGKNFTIRINKGAGAFVCGEGSALTASIEGKRGMPRVKPPRTVEKGLFECPTVLNNVETFANVPKIIEKGADWFLTIGTDKNNGTKAFALTGKIQNTGLVEVPMGTTLREVVFDIGGGIRDGGKFKGVQIGGPSGGCLTEKDLDLPLDFDSLSHAGAMIGSGGLVVMDDSTCMVEVARFFMNFTKNESCGKCVPCREGTKRMHEILERIVSGNGVESDIDDLLELADVISNVSLCGLGKSAPSPVVSTIKNFREEFMAHIVDKKCPTGVCEKLAQIVIEESKCKGCTKCAKVCPVNAISGVVKEPHIISQDKCIKCRACVETCPFGAIVTA